MFQPESPQKWQYYINPWWSEDHVFTTRLSKAECKRRLKEDTTWWLSRTVARAIVSTADFTLHRVTFFSNGFRPYAYVNFDESTPPDTTVRVTLSSSNSARLFFVIWYGFLVLIAATVLFSTVAREPISDAALSFLVLIGFVAAPVLFTAFGRGISAGDRRFLTEFLVEELELAPAQLLPAAIIQ